jgi:negative regulator of flagellin synthesis FlgM
MNNIGKIAQYSTDAVQGLNATTSKSGKEDKAGAVKDQGATADRVELSKDYQEMVRTKEVTMSRDELRTEKIDLIRSRLADGTYQINPEAIAGEMLDDMI